MIIEERYEGILIEGARRNRAGSSPVKRCTDPYIDKVYKIDSTPCSAAASGGPCQWEGRFGVSVYNIDPATVTYKWSSSIGTHPAGSSDTDPEYTLWVQSDTNEIVTVTCTITENGVSHTRSKDFMTENA